MPLLIPSLVLSLTTDAPRWQASHRHSTDKVMATHVTSNFIHRGTYNRCNYCMCTTKLELTDCKVDPAQHFMLKLQCVSWTLTWDCACNAKVTTFAEAAQTQRSQAVGYDWSLARCTSTDMVERHQPRCNWLTRRFWLASKPQIRARAVSCTKTPFWEGNPENAGS